VHICVHKQEHVCIATHLQRVQTEQIQGARFCRLCNTSTMQHAMVYPGCMGTKQRCVGLSPQAAAATWLTSQCTNLLTWQSLIFPPLWVPKFSAHMLASRLHRCSIAAQRRCLGTKVPGPLVNAAWLKARIEDRDSSVKVLDSSWYMPAMNRNPKAEFAAGRVPSAQFFDIDDNRFACVRLRTTTRR
jgi:hypothetical protein